jgi:hypothetical protein
VCQWYPYEDNGSVRRLAARSVLMVTLILLVVAAADLYAFPRSLDVSFAAPGRWDLGMAIVVAGYLMFPVLALLVAGLLLSALLVLAGAALERRLTTRPSNDR